LVSESFTGSHAGGALFRMNFSPDLKVSVPEMPEIRKHGLQNE
jgi:hypothetical protein